MTVDRSGLWVLLDRDFYEFVGSWACLSWIALMVPVEAWEPRHLLAVGVAGTMLQAAAMRAQGGGFHPEGD